MREVASPKALPNLNCVVASLRLFINVPILVIKPCVKEKKGTQKGRINTGYKWYTNVDDSKLSLSEFPIILADNGFDFMGPCLPMAVVQVRSLTENVTACLNNGLRSLEELNVQLPVSEYKSSYLMIAKLLTAAREVAAGTALATGTANKAAVASAAAALPSAPLTARAPTRKRRLSASATVVETKKVKVGESEPQEGEEEKTEVQETEETQETTESQETKSQDKVAKPTFLAEFQCPCGLDFTSKEEVDDHIVKAHVGNLWQCSYTDCKKVYSGKGARSQLWRHVRTCHLKAYTYQCPDPQCNFKGSETKDGYYFHREKVHGEKTQVRCQKCDKPFPEKIKLKHHELNCGVNVRIKNYFCPYKAEGGESCTHKYRSKESLDTHIKQKHPSDEVSTVVFRCVPCNKVFAASSGLRNHNVGKHGFARVARGESQVDLKENDPPEDEQEIDPDKQGDPAEDPAKDPDKQGEPGAPLGGGDPQNPEEPENPALLVPPQNIPPLPGDVHPNVDPQKPPVLPLLPQLGDLE